MSPTPPMPSGLHPPNPLAQRSAGATVLASLLLGLAGCALLQPPPPPPAPPPVVAPAPPPPPPAEPTPAPAPPAPAPPDPALQADVAARRLLAWQDRLRELGAADIARDIQRLDLAARQANGGDATEAAAATLELALLLGQTRHNGDLARALALTDGLARNDTAPAWQALARLLQPRLAEQRRLEEQTERQAQQLRDQQRRLEQLSSQLEALKAIERSLNARPSAPSPAPGVGPGTGRNPP